MERLADDGKLAAYRHSGYWQNMDTPARQDGAGGAVGLGAAAVEGVVSAPGRPAASAPRRSRRRSSTSASRRSQTRCSTSTELARDEPRYPLHAYVCGECFLVQLGEFATPEDIFEDYVYFSSYSDSWVEHARRYVERAVERFDARRRQPASSRSPRTTATCSSGSWSAACRCSAWSPPRTSPRPPRRRGFRRSFAFFGRETAAELVGDGHRGRLVVGEQRPRARAGAERLRRRACRCCSRPTAS